MKVCLLICFSMSVLSVRAQDDFNKELTGELSPALFRSDEEMSKWFTKAYNHYTFDTAVVQPLKNKLDGKQIVVVLGTWCSDSQQFFPELMKVLDAVGFPMWQLKILGVNRNKSFPEEVVSNFKITNVPTILLLDSDGFEVGRITESVHRSVEVDLLNL